MQIMRDKEILRCLKNQKIIEIFRNKVVTVV